MLGTPTQLLYGDLPTRWGVTCERTDKSLRIVTPPLNKIRYLPTLFKIGFGYALVTTITMAIVIGLKSDSWGDGRLANLLIYSTALLILLAYAIRMLRNRTLLEVDASYLMVSRLSRGRPRGIRRWPRTQIGTIKLNRDTGALLIHVLGQTLVELRISGEPQVTEWIADQLQDALRTLPHEPKPAPSLPDPDASMRPGLGRSALLAISLVLTAVGVALLSAGLPWCALSMYVFILAAAPVGIAMGSQKKDFYM